MSAITTPNKEKAPINGCIKNITSNNDNEKGASKNAPGNGEIINVRKVRKLAKAREPAPHFSMFCSKVALNIRSSILEMNDIVPLNTILSRIHSNIPLTLNARTRRTNNHIKKGNTLTIYNRTKHCTHINDGGNRKIRYKNRKEKCSIKITFMLC